ncbi:arsenate reductase family protein [Spirochaeta isovalerica]|uniref:Arsenate reductase n=1 Tax=Spirochaeta isovalerica TaxID=150 RepID=A0A841R2X8_9SPIO|nr:arsenate reductase family protein [Spirochaeta isovalerica]MBB6479394.1 arsenate reductase [Spirochaeta isovalerica]
MSEYVLYQYPTCSTCRKAIKWLDGRDFKYNSHHIVEETPAAAEIKNLIEKSGLPFRKFFNTSGKRYRELGIKDRLEQMTADDAAELLASDGMLLKRPIIIKNEIVLVGFKETEWSHNL